MRRVLGVLVAHLVPERPHPGVEPVFERRLLGVHPLAERLQPGVQRAPRTLRGPQPSAHRATARRPRSAACCAGPARSAAIDGDRRQAGRVRAPARRRRDGRGKDDLHAGGHQVKSTFGWGEVGPAVGYDVGVGSPRPRSRPRFTGADRPRSGSWARPGGPTCNWLQVAGPVFLGGGTQLTTTCKLPDRDHPRSGSWGSSREPSTTARVMVSSATSGRPSRSSCR